MPSVSVLSPTSAIGNFGPSASSSGPARDDGRSVKEIKDEVKTMVQRARGASAITLLNVAREKAISGFRLEDETNLPEALRELLTAAKLIQLFLETAEFKAESQGRKGVVWKEFTDFQQQYGNDLIPAANRVEAKLSEYETQRAARAPVRKDSATSPSSGISTTSGGSVLDRIKSLQDSGLSVSTRSKRSSRDLSFNGSANAMSQSSSSAPFQPQSPHISGSSSTHSHSQHSFVAPSSLGLPSPASSPSLSAPSSPSVSSLPQAHSHTSVSTPSPRTTHFPSASEFSTQFPSIDELDERASGLPELPSVPTTIPGSSVPAVRRLPQPPVSPTASVLNRFPSIYLDGVQRPASTPIPAVNDVSRPNSPSLTHGQGYFPTPPSPVVPAKPSNLSMTGTGGSTSGSSSRVSNANVSTPKHTGEGHSPRMPDSLPVTNTIVPTTLHEYLSRKEINVLLLDLRTREEFSEGRINASAVVCLDPYVLGREGLTGEQLEDSLTVAPRNEHTLFRNRNQFDLVVFYDQHSQSFGPPSSTLNVCVKVIYEQAFRKMLKKPPVLLVGGFEAWKAKFPREVTLSTGAAVDPIPGMETLGSSASSSHPVIQPSAYGPQGFVANGHVEGHDPSQELWSASTTGSRSHVMDQIPEDESAYYSTNGIEAQKSPMPAPVAEPARRLVRKPSLARPPSSTSLSSHARGIYDNSLSYSQSGPNGVQSHSSGGISYPQFGQPSTSSTFGMSMTNQASVGLGMGVGVNGMVSPPPQASINPSPLSRRRSRSDYIFPDQSEQTVSSFVARPTSIDYPDLSTQHVVRPPPAAATAPNERQDNRPRLSSHSRSNSLSLTTMPSGIPNGHYGRVANAPTPPLINSDYPVMYWPDMLIATSGLKNLVLHKKVQALLQ